MATKVLDDLATRFMSFSDALESQFGDLSIDFSLPSKTTLGGKASRTAGGAAAAGGNAAAGDARALSAAAEEREAAKKRGEAILQQLPPGYFESSFDALQHELRQMEPDARQDDIDVVVDRLTSAMEVVSMRLARHVLKNQDKLIAGITIVTHVEDDVKAAYVVCRGSRAQLRTAADEVQRQIKIITSTRKKQSSMEVLDVLSRVKRVKDLPAALRAAHEEADHAEAILLCVDGFHAVDSLSNCKIAPALQVAVQRAYYDAMQQLNTALMNVCADFQGDSYSRLLEAYLLQGVPPEALADKVLTCFNELLRDVSTRLVRSMVLARAFAQQSDNGAPSADSPRGSSGGVSTGGAASAQEEGLLHLEQCSFADLCRRVTPDILQPCMAKLLESVHDLLASYHSMLTWHEAGLAEHTQAAAAAAAAAASVAARSPEHSQGGAAPCSTPGAASSDEAGGTGGESVGAGAGADAVVPSQEQLDQVQAATKGILAGVRAALLDSRMATAEAAAILVKELLVGAGGCTHSDFAQVVGSTLRFAALAESFACRRLPTRDALLHILGAFVRGAHKSSMQTLKQALAAETWAVAAVAAAPAGPGCVQHSLSGAAYQLPGWGEEGCVGDFSEVLQAGNPFRKQGRTAGGRSVITASGNKVAAAPAAAAAAAPCGGGVSRSCLLVLQMLADNAGLMVPLPSQQQQLWGGMAELFENYLLACFVLFSGVSLQTLVWQDDCLPHRLRSALLRITTGANCKYKAEVEELQRTKPAPASLDATSSSSILSGGAGSTGSSKLDAFTRKFKHTMVELINADLSQPINSNESHHSPIGPSLLTPRQQQQQQGAGSSQQRDPSRSTTPSTPRQQQQASQQPQQQPQGTTPSEVSSTAAASEHGAAITSSSSQPAAQPGGQQRDTFLERCVVAIDSLTLLADALRAARPGLLPLLGSGKGAAAATSSSSSSSVMSKEVEGFFSRTVDAAVDLRDAIYLGAAKQLLPGLADAEYGLASAITECNYQMTEPATRYNPWVAEVVQQYTAFGKFVAASTLPPDVQHKFWDAALRLGSEAMLSGLGQVMRCSQQGRAAMSLDLSAVEKGLRPLAPPSSLASLRRVDAYIKAFYIPWEEVGRWAQTHLAEYGKGRVLVLVECMADAYGVRRGQRAALMDSIRAQLSEFA